jgi:hypothetical protein
MIATTPIKKLSDTPARLVHQLGESSFCKDDPPRHPGRNRLDTRWGENNVDRERHRSFMPECERHSPGGSMTASVQPSGPQPARSSSARRRLRRSAMAPGEERRLRGGA